MLLAVVVVCTHTSARERERRAAVCTTIKVNGELKSLSLLFRFPVQRCRIIFNGKLCWNLGIVAIGLSRERETERKTKTNTHTHNQRWTMWNRGTFDSNEWMQFFFSRLVLFCVVPNALNVDDDDGSTKIVTNTQWILKSNCYTSAVVHTGPNVLL